MCERAYRRIHAQQGYPITGVLRIFHGDGPAQQVEAGSKIGGNYPCVGCKSQSVMLGDLAYKFQADIISTVVVCKERQNLAISH